MTAVEEEARRRAERARRVALFRYELIQGVIDPSLSTRQRGAAGAPDRRACARRPVRGEGASVPGHGRPLVPVVACGRAGGLRPFEADRSIERWVGDALHGPVVGGRRTFLFAFLDDRSRAVMAARFGFHEDTVRLAAALRPALASRGVPESI